VGGWRTSLANLLVGILVFSLGDSIGSAPGFVGPLLRMPPVVSEVIDRPEVGTGGECEFPGAREYKHACPGFDRESLDRLPESNC
jgi:hypothetical protein